MDWFDDIRASELLAATTMIASVVGWSAAVECDPNHLPSRRILDDLGFVHTGARSVRLADGRWIEG